MKREWSVSTALLATLAIAAYVTVTNQGDTAAFGTLHLTMGVLFVAYFVVAAFRLRFGAPWWKSWTTPRGILHTLLVGWYLWLSMCYLFPPVSTWLGHPFPWYEAFSVTPIAHFLFGLLLFGLALGGMLVGTSAHPSTRRPRLVWGILSLSFLISYILVEMSRLDLRVDVDGFGVLTTLATVPAAAALLVMEIRVRGRGPATLEAAQD